MSHPHRPRRGSIAYSPRVRARSEIPRVRAWPMKKEPKLLGFAGYKAGMTHIIMIDDVPNSLTAGMEVSIPVTILEAPPMRAAGIRIYDSTAYGAHTIAEAWTTELDKELNRTITVPKKNDLSAALARIDQLINDGVAKDLRIIMYTLPDKVTGIPKKKPEIMENNIGGTDLKARFEYAKTLLGKTINISDVFNNGDTIDVLAITTGKGTQGPVKRWGIQLQKSKHSRAGSVRQIGTLGPWHPSHVSWRVPQLGQTGYHQRTEFNKRIMQIGKDGKTVTPEGGFLNYGIVRNDYVVIKGSVPGPVKRLVRIRPAIRSKRQLPAPEITYLSTESKQG
ncbi:LSU ribosomal protein L3P [Candidatus Methanoperedens nitroreducens]|uniref:Large ribosomal subunit protein uL3 n=1 Tax=Candidatus Methanoperedens nitratireducens TaxID=1392998 RepID=A0A062V9V0_9EURY|nr:50S ribosomal protein L3 [Candidatus Methanoperedens nitroreducens]KCZ73308.1 LSU ribosomal protein L3P [Candidatus Methanoperedens nitroreducens]MDJ1422743.1 50S ribosomal protein L3 [Candidatus Methanoperedens sp.]